MQKLIIIVLCMFSVLSLIAQKKIKIPQIKPDFVLFDRVDFYDNRREPYERYDGEMVPEGDGTYKIPEIEIHSFLLYSTTLGINNYDNYPLIDVLWINEPTKDSIYNCAYLSVHPLTYKSINRKSMWLWFRQKLPNTLKIPEKYKKNKVTLRFRFKNKTYILSSNNINFIIK